MWSLERGLREVPREKYGGPRVTCYGLNLFASETSSLQRSIILWYRNNFGTTLFCDSKFTVLIMKKGLNLNQFLHVIITSLGQFSSK